MVGGILLAALCGAPGVLTGFPLIGAGLSSLQASLQLDCTHSKASTFLVTVFALFGFLTFDQDN